MCDRFTPSGKLSEPGSSKRPPTNRLSGVKSTVTPASTLPTVKETNMLGGIWSVSVSEMLQVESQLAWRN